MSTPPPFTISSEALTRFPEAIQKTIVDVVQSELEKARSNCIHALASPSHTGAGPTRPSQTPMDEAWQREATGFMNSIETFLNSCPNVKRGPNFKADSKQILEDAFQRSQFLNKAECRIVAKAAGLSCQQVRTWFQNKRNRSSKKVSKSDAKARARSHSKKKTSSKSTRQGSVATTDSRPTSTPCLGFNATTHVNGSHETVMDTESRVLLAVPHRVEEIGLAIQDEPAPALSFGVDSAAHRSTPHPTPVGEAPLWLGDASGATESSSQPHSVTDSIWTRAHQSCMDPNAAPFWGPSQADSEEWLSADNAAFVMTASSFLEFPDPVSGPS